MKKATYNPNIKIICVLVRENKNGNVWCSATIEGYDYSSEGKTRKEAIELFKKEVEKLQSSFTLSFEPTYMYKRSMKVTLDQTHYRRPWLDKGMV